MPSKICFCQVLPSKIYVFTTRQKDSVCCFQLCQALPQKQKILVAFREGFVGLLKKSRLLLIYSCVTSFPSFHMCHINIFSLSNRNYKIEIFIYIIEIFYITEKYIFITKYLYFNFISYKYYFI